MNIQNYIEGLFIHYPNSPAMDDFKEELASNLQARISYLSGKGMTENEAFRKATEELGDITEIANQISEDKRREVIETMYMKNVNYLDKAHITGYTIAGSLVFIGFVTGLLLFAQGNFLNALLLFSAFFIPAGCGFVYLFLTQETAADYPMDKKRARVYAVDTGLILFGVLTFLASFYGKNLDLVRALSLPVLFIFPAAILLAVLLMSEKSRNKPWVLEQQAAWSKHFEMQYSDSYTTTKFGLLSGALWIFAITLFLAIGLFGSFHYSWLVFPFAVAIQLLVQALMVPKQ